MKHFARLSVERNCPFDYPMTAVENISANEHAIKRMPWSARLTAISLAGILATASIMLLSPQSYAAFESKTYTKDNIVIHRHPNRTLKLDFARPKTGKGPFPLIVCIHGGGWAQGNRKQMREQMLNFAKAGFASACIEYRLTSQAKYPAQVNDSTEAINYLIDHASKLRINAKKIALFGGSAGGHIALMLSEVQNDIDRKSLPLAKLHSPVCATASLAGPTNLNKQFRPAIQGIVDNLFSDADRENIDGIAQNRINASPITFADAQDPPMLLVHGTNDDIVPFDQAEEMMTVCKSKNVHADLITIEGAGHGGGGNKKDWDSSVAKLLQFFREHLMG